MNDYSDVLEDDTRRFYLYQGASACPWEEWADMAGYSTVVSMVSILLSAILTM